VRACGPSVDASICLKTVLPGQVVQTSINIGSSKGAEWQDRKDNEGDGVTIIYSHGDVCGNDNSHRKTVVQMECNPHSRLNKRELDNKVTSFISSVTQWDACTTRMTVKTPYACTTKHPSVCKSLSTREACFSQGTSCECAWCEGSCVASYETCTGVREIQCAVQPHRLHGITVVLMLTSLPLLGLLLCLCCCTCFRRKALKHRLDDKLRLPQKKMSDDVAMEPLIMESAQPQYVFVQYPMPTGQQNPPLFAPNPMFIVPQYGLPVQEDQK